MRITIFKNVMSQQGKIIDISWEDFKDTYFINRIPQVLQNKLATPAYVGGEIEGADRSSGHNKVLYRDLIVLDVDGIEVKNEKALPLTDDKAAEFVAIVKDKLARYNYLIHTTYSCSKDKNKYRILIPLANSLQEADFRHAVLYLCNLIGIKYFDDASATINQLMLFPSIPSANSKCAIFANKGVFFDYNVDVDKEADLQQFVNAKKQLTNEPTKIKTTKSDDNNILDSVIVDKNNTIPEGQRDDAIYTFAWQYRNAGLTQEEANILCRFKNQNCEPPLPIEQVEKCVKSAYKCHRDWLVRDKKGKQTIIVDKLAEELNKNNDYICNHYLLYHYQNGYWQADWDDFNLLNTLSNDQYYIPSVLNEPSRNRKIIQQLKDKATQKTQDGMNLPTKKVVNFKNGIFDIDKEVFVENHDDYKNLYLTKQIQWDYKVPDVCLTDTVFYNFLLDMMANKENVQMFMEFVGYCMVNTTEFQQMLVLKGNGGIGKSTILDMVTRVFGCKNVANESLVALATDRWSTYQLMDKYVNICGDISGEALKDTSVLKQITGEDYVRAEQKGKDPISFKIGAKLIFSANRIPYNKDEQTNAFYRRLVIIPCKKTKYIDDLKNKLEAETEVFIYYCLQAYLRIKNNRSVTISADCKNEVDRIWEESDTVKAFCKSLVTMKGHHIRLKILYSHYKEWCMTEERDAETKTLKTFKNILQQNDILLYTPTTGDDKNVLCVKDVCYMSEVSDFWNNVT